MSDWEYSFNQGATTTQGDATVEFGDDAKVDGSKDITVSNLAEDGYVEFTGPNGVTIKLTNEGTFNLDKLFAGFNEQCKEDSNKLDVKERILQGAAGVGEVAGSAVIVGGVLIAAEKGLAKPDSVKTGLIVGLAVFGDGMNRIFAGAIGGRKPDSMIGDIVLPTIGKMPNGQTYPAWSFAW